MSKNLHNGNGGIADPVEDYSIKTPEAATTQAFSHSIRFAYNPKVTNKTDRHTTLNHGYLDASGTIPQIIATIKRGYALSSCLYGGKGRKVENFAGSQWILVDVDNKDSQSQLTLDDALSHPLLRDYAAFIYTSFSHNDDQHRFRIGFILPEFVTDARIYQELIKLVTEQIPHDKQCRGIATVFYGNTGAIVPLQREGVTLPLEWISKAQERLQKRLQQQKDFNERRQAVGLKQAIVEHKSDVPSEVIKALSFIPRREPGRGNDAECFRVLQSLVNEFGHDGARLIAQNWSPSGVHPDWDLEKKLGNVRNSKIKIDELFKIAQTYGYEFPYSRYQSRQIGNSRLTASKEQLDQAEADHLEEERQKAELLAAKQLELKQKFHESWLADRSFTPDQVINQRYLDKNAFIKLLEQFDVLAVRSAMGTGKTEIVIEILRSWDKAVLALGSRNSLLLQSRKRWSESGVNFYHLSEDDATGMVSDPHGRIACCVDSLDKFQDNHFDDRLLILDEATSTAVHLLLSGTVKKKGRSSILKKFEQAVKRADKILLLDGNLNDLVVNYIIQIRADNNTKLLRLLNTQPAPKLNIELITAIDDKDAAKESDSSPILQNALLTLESHRSAPLGTAKAICIIADSQKLLAAYDRLFTGKGYKVVRIDRETIQQKETKLIAEDPDSFLERENVDVLLLSPTCEMGLNVAIQNYFTKCYALFFAILGTDSQLQFLRRIRHCSDWSIWCAKFNRFKSDDPKWKDENKLSTYLSEYLVNDLVLTFEGSQFNDYVNHAIEQIESNRSNLHCKTAYRIIRNLNYERSNSRHCLTELLKESNDIKEVFELQNKTLNSAVKGIKAEIRREQAEARFNAEDITIDEAREIKKSFSSSTEDNYKADKAFLKDELPGIEDTALWTVEFFEKYFDKAGRQDIRAARRYWMLKNLRIAKVVSQATWLSIGTTINKPNDEFSSNDQPIEFREIFTPDIQNDFAYIKCLTDLGFLGLIGDDQYSSESDVIQDIHRRAKFSKGHQIALKRSISHIAPMEFVNRIMRSIGVDPALCSRPGKHSETNRDRIYSYSDPLLTAEDFKILYECVDRKLRGKAHKHINKHFPLIVPGIPHYAEWMRDDLIKTIDEFWTEAHAYDEQTLEGVREWVKEEYERFLAAGGEIAHDATEQPRIEPDEDDYQGRVKTFEPDNYPANQFAATAVEGEPVTARAGHDPPW